MKSGTTGVLFLLSYRVWVWYIQRGSAWDKCGSREKEDRKQKPWVSKAMRRRESESSLVSSSSWKNKQVERNRRAESCAWQEANSSCDVTEAELILHTRAVTQLLLNCGCNEIWFSMSLPMKPLSLFSTSPYHILLINLH